MTRRTRWWVATLLLLGCQPQAAPSPTLPSSTTEAPSDPITTEPQETVVARSGGGARPATAKERGVVAELVRAAETVRQLKLNTPVTIEIEDGETIAKSLDAQIDAEEVERARVLYGALGLLDPNEDLQALFAGVLGEQVIGYYDPDTGRLVVRDDVMDGLTGELGTEQTQEARLVLVHELVHALQDQRLSLGESYETERTSDADNAFRAVVEGDATLAMLAHALRQQGIPLSAATAGIQQMGGYLDLDALVSGEKLNDAPAILRVTLIAPYLRGLQFIAAVQGRGGWPAVNNAHRRPPATSEQVLHPDKYFGREPGEVVSVKDATQLLDAGFRQAADDTLGELELSIYFGQGQPSGTDEAAAAGWAGDHLVVYRRDETLAAIWWTTWDDEQEASEAYRAAIRVAPDDPTSRVERKGRSVLIVRGLPPKLHRPVRSDFVKFAREIASATPPPEIRPSLVY